MASSLPFREQLRSKFGHVLPQGSRWIHKWDPQRDRLEEFATHFGEDLIRRVDGPSMVTGIGLLALIALAMS